MTIKESIIKSLEEIKGLATHNDIYDYIIKHGYYSFEKGKTPEKTTSALLGDFIRNK